MNHIDCKLQRMQHMKKKYLKLNLQKIYHNQRQGSSLYTKIYANVAKLMNNSTQN